MSRITLSLDRSPVVILLDDDDTVGVFLTEILESYRVIHCRDEREFVTALSRYPAVVLILDIWLRERSGWDVADVIDRAGGALCPLIFLSADESQLSTFHSKVIPNSHFVDKRNLQLIREIITGL